MAVSQYRTINFEVVGSVDRSLSRGTVPIPNPRPTGPLIEGSQLPELRNPVFRLTEDSGSDSVPIDVLAKRKLSLFRPGGMPGKEIQREESLNFLLPQKPP